jgi:hypothetical protein
MATTSGCCSPTGNASFPFLALVPSFLVAFSRPGPFPDSSCAGACLQPSPCSKRVSRSSAFEPVPPLPPSLLSLCLSCCSLHHCSCAAGEEPAAASRTRDIELAGLQSRLVASSSELQRLNSERDSLVATMAVVDDVHARALQQVRMEAEAASQVVYGKIGGWGRGGMPVALAVKKIRF